MRFIYLCAWVSVCFKMLLLILILVLCWLCRIWICFQRSKLHKRYTFPSVSFPPSFPPFLRGSHLQCFLECFPGFSFCNDKQIFFFFPNCSPVKESACSAGDASSVTGLGRSVGRGKGNSLQCSCLKNLMDRGAWLQSTEWQRVGQDWEAVAAAFSLCAHTIGSSVSLNLGVT